MFSKHCLQTYAAEEAHFRIIFFDHWNLTVWCDTFHRIFSLQCDRTVLRYLLRLICFFIGEWTTMSISIIYEWGDYGLNCRHITIIRCQSPALHKEMLILIQSYLPKFEVSTYKLLNSHQMRRFIFTHSTFEAHNLWRKSTTLAWQPNLILFEYKLWFKCSNMLRWVPQRMPNWHLTLHPRSIICKWQRKGGRETLCIFCTLLVACPWIEHTLRLFVSRRHLIIFSH